MKLEFCRNTFEKYSYIQFLENAFNGNRVFHANRRTYEQTVMT